MATVLGPRSCAGSADGERRLRWVGRARVRPISRSLIGPATPTKCHWLPLSNLDRVVNPTFTSVILLYRDADNENQSFQDVIQSLKDSLAKVLVYFYPLAGRLALMDDGLVNIHCNDEGAVFLEASVDADLGSVGGAKPIPFLSGLDFARLGPGPLYMPDQVKTMPTLVVMVTKFTCGAIAVAVNWHHTVADGSSGCHFLQSWAEVSSGKTLSLSPVHNRLLVRASDRGPNSHLRTENFNPDILLEEDRRQEHPPACSEPPASSRVIHMNKALLDKMKDAVSSDFSQLVGECHQFTLQECIVAHFWWQMTKAGRVGSVSSFGDGSSTRLFILVDGREKMSLPAGYFGNAVCSTCAAAGVDEIVSKPVSYALGLISDATRKVSGEYFQNLIDRVEIQLRDHGGFSSGYRPQHMNSLGRDVVATFWVPLDDMDFGWGTKPEVAARNSPRQALIDGIAIFARKQGPENMVVLLNMRADRMKRLTMLDSFTPSIMGQV